MTVSVGDSIVIFSTEKGLRRMYWASFSSSALFFGRDGFAAVDVEDGVFPGVENLNAFGRQEFQGDQGVDVGMEVEVFAEGVESEDNGGMEGIPSPSGLRWG